MAIKENSDEQFQNMLKKLTELKKKEDELRKTRDFLSEAQRIAHLGNWDWNIVTNELIWSDEIYRIFGLKPQEFDATYEAFLNSVHPEDREFVKESVKQALEYNKPYDIDHRIIRANGEERIVHENAEVIFDEERRPSRMLGTVQDITERVLKDEALRKSELMFRRIFESNLIGIFFWNSDRKIIDANDLFLELVGYSREDILSRKISFSDLISPDYVDQEDKFLDASSRKKLLTPIEIEYIRKDGSRFPILFGATLMEETNMGFAFILDITQRRDAEEKLQKSYAELEKRIEARTFELKAINQQLQQEIKERKRAEVTLQQSQIKYQNLYNTAPIAYLTVGINGNITNANQAAQDFLGYELKELKKMYVFQLYAEESKARAKDIFAKFQSGIPSKNEEMIYKQKTGNKVYGLLTVSPIFDEQGKIIESRSIIVNITDRITFENMRRAFIDSVSHQLRTPVSVISQTISNFQKYGDNLTIEQQAKLMSSLERNAKILADLIEELLQFEG